jgi:hypothetical protein
VKTYWDTSGLIRAYVMRQKPQGVTRSHSISEFFCVLSGPGLAVIESGNVIKKALSPTAAAKAAKETFAGLEFIDLTGPQALEAVEDSVKTKDVSGKHIHDWMHCKAAEKCRADRIMTVNLKDFSRMTKLRLEAPSEYPPVHPSPG